MTPHDHNQAGTVSIFLVTVSDTRTPETDANGRYLRDALAAAGHTVADSRIIPDEPAALVAMLEAIAHSPAVAAIFNGGTGIASRDATFDVLSGAFTKQLPGFGEIFRMLSYQDIGAKALLSRAAAGVYQGKAIFSIPGSPAAVRLAWEKLIAPVIPHLASELVR